MTSDCGPDGEIPRGFESHCPPEYLKDIPVYEPGEVTVGNHILCRVVQDGEM